MVIGNRRGRSDRCLILRRSYYGIVYRGHIVGHVNCATFTSGRVLVCFETSGAYQNINRQERCRESRADHQGPQEDHQGQDQFDAWLIEIHDTARADLSF